MNAGRTRKVAARSVTGFALVAVVFLATSWGHPVLATSSACTPPERISIFLVSDISYDELMSIPEVQGLAGSGGAGLLANAEDLAEQGREFAVSPQDGVDASEVEVRVEELDAPSPDAAGRELQMEALARALSGVASEGREWVMVATVGDPGDGGVLNTLVMGHPRPNAPGIPAVLASDSTRRWGVVTGSDLGPTVTRLACEGSSLAPGVISLYPDSIYDVEAPEPGSPEPILTRHLQVRRMAFPVQLVAAIATLAIASVGLLIFFRRDRMPGWALALGRWCCLAVPVLGVAMLMSGHLPTLNYASVGVTLVLATLIVPIAVLWLGRSKLTRPLTLLAVALLAAIAFEALTGWDATLYTMIGGSALDGARFYGLPNAFIGIVLGSTLYLAAVTPRAVGTAIVIGGCVLAGAPSLGANLGGAVTLSVAAGLWLALTGSGRARWAWGAVVAGAALAAVVAAHLWLTDAPTHVTRLATESGGEGPLTRAADRLMIGVRLLRRSPVGIIYLAATPLLLWLVARPRGGLPGVFARWPRWRLAILTMLWSCVVAYFANDTGVAAVGLGFAMALGATLYLPITEALGTRAIEGVPMGAAEGKMEAT